ncbi:MAG: winged helix-turn-helix domain-containing protein, partial [Kiritimatiellae bacterium]|nr:winged helix-turn-helix domain-containing protein [Kiritimatiellia bacterium]
MHYNQTCIIIGRMKEVSCATDHADTADWEVATALSKTDQVQSAIVQAISRQRIRPGKRVPSEAQLMTSLAVSRVTVRRAIGNLVREGVLESRPGFGHVVRSAQGQLTIGIFFGHTFLDVQAVPFHRLLLE